MNTMNSVDALIRDGLPASLLSKPLSEVWIAIRTDGVPDTNSPVVVVGDGTEANPWDGSTALKLDLILSGITYEDITFRFGPGVFRTGGSGHEPLYRKWFPRSGWRFVGAGKYQTTLLLTVYSQKVDPQRVHAYWMFYSTTYLNGFEISDLTIDCGMDDQPLPPDAEFAWPHSMCAAFWLEPVLNFLGK